MLKLPQPGTHGSPDSPSVKASGKLKGPV